MSKSSIVKLSVRMAVQNNNSTGYKNPFLQLFSSQIDHPTGRRLAALLERPIEKALALTGVARMYDAMTGGKDVADFLSRGLKAQNLTYRISPEDSEDIPRQGAGVVVCNHPFGATFISCGMSPICGGI